MTLARFLILGLIGFELLNFFGLLDFTLDFSWAGLIITSLGTFIVMEAIYYLSRRKGIVLAALPYLLVSTGLWLDGLGDIAHLYGKFGSYDQFMHFLGGGIVMAVALTVFSNLKRENALPIFLILFLALSSTAFFGSLYEIEEYLEDTLYHGRQVRLGDGRDTANDLMLNLLGGAAVGLVYFFSSRKK